MTTPTPEEIANMIGKIEVDATVLVKIQLLKKIENDLQTMLKELTLLSFVDNFENEIQLTQNLQKLIVKQLEL